MKFIKFAILILAILLIAACASTTKQSNSEVENIKFRTGLAAHPEDLSFAASEIKIPTAADYRYKLINGNVAYIVPDSSLPLVAVSVNVRAGTYLLKAADAGLADLTASMLRDGGTKSLTPEDLDEKLEFLATTVAIDIGGTSASADMNSLSSNLDESLKLLFDVLAEPRFDKQRLEIKKTQFIEAMKRRNDDTRNIESRVFNEMRFGADSYRSSQATATQIEAINAAAMRAYAQQVFASPNLVISINGDVDPQAMVHKLNKQIARLNKGVKLPPIPTVAKPIAVGLYGVNKDDVTQTRVRMFHPGPKVGDPQEFAIRVMNNILGGGGFTSRITKRVRSDEGLAYSAGSAYPLGQYYPGMYLVYFQSKNVSVPEASKIVLEEIARIKIEPVSAKELSTARQAVISILNERYSNASRVVAAITDDHLLGTPADYWKNYEANTNAVDIAAVQKAAQDHLQPEQLRILLTGKLAEAAKGDGESGSMEAVTGLKLQQIPLKDPLTLKPLPLN